MACDDSLVQGKFEPWQLQERQLRLGITDPISQAPAIFFCNMADNYTFHEATDFVHHLQHNTPQLHYGSLTNAFMQVRSDGCMPALDWSSLTDGL